MNDIGKDIHDKQKVSHNSHNHYHDMFPSMAKYGLNIMDFDIKKCLCWYLQ